MKNAFQLFHLAGHPWRSIFFRKWLPDGSGFQTRDDSSHRDTGLMSFEPDRNSIVDVSICDFESSQNEACNWKILGTTELTLVKLLLMCDWCELAVYASEVLLSGDDIIQTKLNCKQRKWSRLYFSYILV